MAIDRIARLIKIVQENDDADTRLQAIEQLGDPENAGNADVLDALVTTMQGRDDHAMAYKERRAALNALAAIGDKKAIKFIIYALEDTSTPVRVAAAEALGKLHADEAIQPLITVTGDSSDDVREAAVMALGEISAQFPVSVEALIPLLADPEDRVRQIVTDIIEGLNPNATLGFLITALEDPNSTIRGAVAEILGELADERARKALQRTFDNDKSEWVRGRARWALDQLPMPDFPVQVKRNTPAPPPPKDTLSVMRSQKPQWPSLDGTPLQDIDDIQQQQAQPPAPQPAPTPPQPPAPTARPQQVNSGGGITRDQIQAMLDQLDLRLASGEISEATYTRLAQRWQTRLESI